MLTLGNGTIYVPLGHTIPFSV